MIAKVRDNSGAARDSAFTTLRRVLAAHEAAEETFIHSLDDSAVAEQQRVREEEQAGTAVAGLDAMDSATAAFEDASAEQLGRIFEALQLVPELAGQRGGPIEAHADFASMLAGAKSSPRHPARWASQHFLVQGWARSHGGRPEPAAVCVLVSGRGSLAARRLSGS